MHKRNTLLSICFLLASLMAALAQSWTDEQREVWSVIEAQWKAEMAKDTTWARELHPKFSGWSSDAPSPDGPKDAEEWSRFHQASGTTLVQKLHPLRIIVHGNTAVAHYYYSEGREDSKKERKVVHGRYTDVLVKEDGKWRFIAWHGGEAPAKAN